MSKRNQTPVSLALDPDLLARLEAWRAAQTFPPSKRQVFETALAEFLDRQDG